jgi:hypothetical protein
LPFPSISYPIEFAKQKLKVQFSTGQYRKEVERGV